MTSLAAAPIHLTLDRQMPTMLRAFIAVAAVISVAGACAAEPQRDAGRDSEMIREIVGQISAARIEAGIRTLAAFGTRNTLSETGGDKRGIGAARRWIKAELDRCSSASGGRLEVKNDEFVAQIPRQPASTTLVNVVATLPGDQPESRDRMYVVSGHYDSRASDVMDAASDAPGANDDASGTAAIMELACVMSRYRFDATLVFMAVAGEEQGLIGSSHWARQASDKGLDIAGMITNDIIGSSRDENGKVDATRVRLFAEGVPATAAVSEDMRTLLRTSGENDTPSRSLARFIKDAAERNVPDMKVDVVYRRDRYLRGGDHIPFLEQGYPAVRLTEPAEDFRHQHQDVRIENGVQYGDLLQFVDFDYAAKVARVNAAALAALALGPAAPRGVEMETIRLENDTTLRWQPNAEPDVASYRILWRETTAAFWQGSKDVGKVTRYTMPGLSKDNLIFAVQALDRDGNASVDSYPRPYRH